MTNRPLRLHLVATDNVNVCQECGATLIKPVLLGSPEIELTSYPIAVDIPDVWARSTWNCERVPAPAGKPTIPLSTGGKN